MALWAFPRLLVGLMLVAAACGQGSGQTAATPTPGTSAGAPASISPVTTSSGPAASPSPSAAVPAALGASPSASPTGATASAADETARFAIASDQSQARFIAREQLAANTIQTDAIGTTKDVSGQVVVDASGRIGEGSKITVGLQSLTSDRSQRDAFIKRNTLQTGTYPTAEFTPTEAQGLALPVPRAGVAHFMLLGDMTVHGVTKPLAWDVDGTFSDHDVTGKASTVVRLDMFGMSKPQVPTVASIADDIRLEVDFTASRS